ncbi:MAG: fimbrillin family protein, partial [Paramuribaculum sp.]|nr:fimbrillin family protein [Paramuribaculum sp.]
MTFHVHQIKLFLIAALAVLLASCRDENILPDTEKLEETDDVQFLVRNEINTWQGLSRAGDINDEDWSELATLDKDNIPYPKLIIKKDTVYEPAITTRAPYNPEYVDPDNADKGVIRYPIPGTYSLPLDVQSTSERYGRLKVMATEFSDKAINELRGLGAQARYADSRSTIADKENVADLYSKIGVSAICFEDAFSFKPHQYRAIDNELVIREGNRWKTTENNYYWNVWTDDFNHLRFYAYAPFQTPGLTVTDDDEDGTPQFEYLVAKDVDDQIDLGGITIDAPANFRRTVPLRFDHILSGVRFLVDDQNMAGKLTRITIGGIYGEGRYKYSIKPYDLTDYDDFSNPNINGGAAPGQEIEKGTWTPLGDANSVYELKDKGVDLYPEDREPILSEFSQEAGEEYWCVTDPDRMFMLLPQKLPETAYIEAEFWDGEEQIIMRGKIGGEDKEGKQREWEQGVIYTYVITTYDVEYVLKLVKEGGLYPYQGGFDDKTVVSYAKYYDKSGNIRKIVPVPWVPAFYDRDGMEVERPDWVNVYYDRDDPKKDYRPSEYDYSAYGSDVNAFVTYFEEQLEDLVCHGHVVVGPQDALRTNPHTAALRNAKLIGSVENPVNLAGMWANRPNETVSTANSYIVNNPGYFNIPLVYGNGIKNGAVNSQAWNGIMNNTGKYPFMTHLDGVRITQPYLKNTAPIKDAAIIATNINHAVQLVHLSDDYLTIYVDSAYIGQGNTTVCIRDDVGNIMWSWHIWTTDYDPYDPTLVLENMSKGTIRIPNNIGETYDFMQINLGWVHPEDLESGPRRTIYWRPVQTRGKAVIQPTDRNKLPDKLTEEPGKFTTKNKYRISQEHYMATHSGYAPYYNWGRKDALLRTLHLPFPASFVNPAVLPGKYSYRWIFDNEELTSEWGRHSVTEGYWYYGNLTMEQSHRLPWPLICNYNLKLDDSGNILEGSTDNDYYVTWWNGKYNAVKHENFVPVRLADQEIRPMGHLNGT